MPKLSDIRRIVPEEYAPEDQEIASNIAGSYNEFADEIYTVVNGQLDWDNLARRKVDITLNIGDNGSIIGNSIINTSLTFVSGIKVINSICSTNQALRFTSAPAVAFAYKGNGQISLLYTTGLPNGKWTITLEVIQ